MLHLRIALPGFVIWILCLWGLDRALGLAPGRAALVGTMLSGLLMVVMMGAAARPRNHLAWVAGLVWVLAWALIAAGLVPLLPWGKVTKPLFAAAFAALTTVTLAQPWGGGGKGRGWPLAGLGLGVFGLAALSFWQPPATLSDDGADLRKGYAAKRSPATGPLRVYHLGHSLVGRDMPAMLAQLAGAGHRYDLQLGWGTSLREHFEPDLTINGFAEENDTPHYRDAHEALASGDHDAFVMTEMVTLKDAIRYHDSPRYAANWAAEATRDNPDIAVFLYETWHGLDQQPDWLARLPADLDLWTSGLLWPATRAAGRPVYLIPAGQVMARLVKTIEAQPGGIGGVTSRRDLFARLPDGQIDPIHVNDLGAYLVALTHYAVIYGQSPVGLPHRLLRADGSAADAPSPELAQLMQATVWDVVQGLDLTGI